MQNSFERITDIVFTFSKAGAEDHTCMRGDVGMKLDLRDNLLFNWDKRSRSTGRIWWQQAVHQMCPGRDGCILHNIRRSNDPLKLLVASLTQEGTGKETQYIFV